MTEITGSDLIAMGFKPGRHFGAMITRANELRAEGAGNVAIKAELKKLLPPEPLALRPAGAAPFHLNIDAKDDHERANIEAVKATMTEVMRTPVVKAGAVMPDACPAGGLGTIPVGGVVASEAIHPGMHSSDICCSMAISIFSSCDPAALLDAVHRVTHFGPGGRDEFDMPGTLAEQIAGNPFLRDYGGLGNHHFGTQGDGNHFAYVGTMRSTGATALVTHHGSRAIGARLYKRGMAAAESFRKRLSPETPKVNAWLPADSDEGRDYWHALQIIRAWTKANHFALHDAAAEVSGKRPRDRFWNEHNFVFRKADGLFYHAKGATPAFEGWARDATDLTLIPLNMAEPVLLVRGRNAQNGLGFSPHGAGRNWSRTQHRKRIAERAAEDALAEETAGIDARFFMGIPDLSELPSAYKSAASMRAQIERYGLAEVVDEVQPHGCIMAGDWEQEAPWRKKRS